MGYEKAGYEPLPVEVEWVGNQIVGAALAVHRALGPGLLESVYETCLAREMAKRRINFVRQLRVPIVYDGEVIDGEFRVDLMVEDCIVVEVKAVEGLTPLFQAQVMTYLKLTDKRLGFLINFNVPMVKDGIKRIVR